METETENKEQTAAALAADEKKTQQDSKLDYPLSQVLQWLYPWYEKTKGIEVIADWEVTLPAHMLTNLMNMWLTPEGRKKAAKILHKYHPVDRSAMIYALLIYLLTGKKLALKHRQAQSDTKLLFLLLQLDMVEIAFAGHLKFMLNKYGKKRQTKKQKE